MTNFEYKYEKYYTKFSNANNIFKKLKYISKILYYKKFINDQTGGGMLDNKTKEIENILNLIPLIITKMEILNNIYKSLLEYDEIILYFDNNHRIYNKDNDLIDYYNNIIININKQ
jgi:hypothetical protein